MNIALVIGWKFPNQAGMKCRDIEGVLQIVEFPGGIPSQALQDTWTAEYQAYKGSNTEKDSDLQSFLDSPVGKAVKAMMLVGIDKGLWTLAELRTKYRTL